MMALQSAPSSSGDCGPVGDGVGAGSRACLRPAAEAVASAVGPLHSLRCTPLPSDQPVEAPLYAQQEGANGATDGWWCQMPHATEVPAQFGELKSHHRPAHLSILPLLDLLRRGVQGRAPHSPGDTTSPASR